jgi:hypothetical protein
MKSVILIFYLFLFASCSSLNKKIESVPGFSLWAHESGHYSNTYRDLGKDLLQIITIDNDSVYFEYHKKIDVYDACPELDYIYLKFPNDSIKKFIPNTIYTGESTIFYCSTYTQYISIAISDIINNPLPIKTRFINHFEVIDTSPIYGEDLIHAINNYRKWKDEEHKKGLIEQYYKRINDSINNIRLNNHLHGF